MRSEGGTAYLYNATTGTITGRPALLGYSVARWSSGSAVSGLEGAGPAQHFLGAV